MKEDSSPRPAGFERQLDPVGRIVARLIESTDSHECDRLLLDAVFVLQAAEAAAIFRYAGDRWCCSLERGPSETLSAHELVVAVLEGSLSSDVLPAGRAVLRAGSGEGALALSLGGTESREGLLDILEALLHVARSLRGIEIPLRGEVEFPPRPSCKPGAKSEDGI